jgi:uncharacterized membrane protein YfcA
VFSTPLITFYDTLRLVNAGLSLAVIFVTAWAITRRGMPWDQRVRFLGTPIVAVAFIGSNLASLGTPSALPWVLPAIVVGMSVYLVGVGVFVVRSRQDDRTPGGRHAE